MRNFLLILCGLCVVFAFQASALAQTVTNQPQSITVNNASTATFTVGASNATSYQWQFNATNLSDGGNITGSTNSALTLEDVSSNQAGTYTVLINNSVTSSNAILTIVPGTIVTFTLTNFLGGGSSNVTVQLFDHDKPATVANFIHYITSGAYTNMFFDRCSPGFVLQGGDDGASNRTSASSPMTGWDIASYTARNQFNPPFPPQINNEFGFGPLIHNRFGTIAMALNSTTTNSATSAFFFNLVDNTSILDSQSFTVFGRIMNNSNEMSSSNVLSYFNTLSNGFGAVQPAAFSDYGTLTTIPSLDMLPVNYLGTNLPANANLVFCDFTFLTSPPVYATPPNVSITSPADDAVWTNGSTGPLEGTATYNSNAGLADVVCTMIPQAAGDGTYANGGTSVTNYAIGTSTWSLNFLGTTTELLYGIIPETVSAPMPPGNYQLIAQSQDGAGNLSTVASQQLTITGILIDGDGTVILTQGSNIVTTTPVGYPLQEGTTYLWQAKPNPGQTFVNWTFGNYIVTNRLLSFDYEGGLLAAHFIATNTPKGAKGISFTYPTANARLATNSFLLKGKIADSIKSAQVTCQISSLSTMLEVGPPLTTSGTNTWSVAVTNLPADSYLVQAVATNAEGFSTVISEEFSVLDFKGVTGTYSGLFLCTNAPVAPTNSGLFTLKVSASGTFSAKVIFPAYEPVSFDYYFPPTGSINFDFTSFHGSPLYFSLNLDLSNGTGSVQGTISSEEWSSQLFCYRAATELSTNTPAEGKYIFSLNPTTNVPGTNGYASLSVGNSGALTLSGALPDGASFSQSARMAMNGAWPLYAVPTGYKSKGMLMGWEFWQTNGNSGSYTGQLYWFKNPHLGAYYTNGVDDPNVISTGTNYLAPAATNYSIVFQGGTMSVPVTNNLTMVHAGGQFNPGSTTDKLAISLSANGVLTGHFVTNNASKPLQFKGAFFGQSAGGMGFILEGNGQTGYFLLEAQ